MSLEGKPFYGNEGVVGIQAWLKTHERVFENMGVTDRQKVQIASSFLQDGASDWFDVVSAEIGEEELTWERFRERFELRFIPEAEKAILARRFIELKQRDMTVQEYVNTFNSLSKYGPDLVNTPFKKNQKFVDGLRRKLKEQLLTQLRSTFDEIVDLAMRYEDLYRERDDAPPNRQNFVPKRKAPFFPKKK